MLSVFLMHRERQRSPHCHSAVSSLWRSWGHEKNKPIRVERWKCDWLAWWGWGGKGRVDDGAKWRMHTQWGIRRWKGSCCYGNTPAEVEYWCCFIDMRAIKFSANRGLSAAGRRAHTHVCVFVCLRMDVYEYGVMWCVQTTCHILTFNAHFQFLCSTETEKRSIFEFSSLRCHIKKGLVVLLHYSSLPLSFISICHALLFP